MFRADKRYRTPVSTYTDDYRLPCSLKKTKYTRTPPQICKENKFVTKGLTMSQEQSTSQEVQPEKQSLEKLTKAVMQEYLYQNAIDPSAYWPEKYWVTKFEEKYSPVFVNEDKYITWRAGPYNSAAWNKYSTYLPPVSQEREVDDVLRGLSRLSSRSLPPVYTMLEGKPFQGYYSPCSGRYYCLQGMDYNVDGNPAIRRHLHALAEPTEYPMLQLQPCSDGLCTYTPGHQTHM